MIGKIIALGSIGYVSGLLLLIITQLLSKKIKSKLRSEFKKVNFFSKKSLLYLLCTVVIITLPVLLSFVIDNILTLYFITFVYTLLLGILHTNTFYRFVDWAEKSVDLVPDIIYTLAIAIFGTVLFITSYQLIKGEGANEYIFNFVLIMLPFVFGIMALKTVMLYALIPDEKFQSYRISTFSENIAPHELRNSTKKEVTFIIEQPKKQIKRLDINMYSDALLGANIIGLLKANNSRPENEKVVLGRSGDEELSFIIFKKYGFFGFKSILDPNKTVVNNKIDNKDEIYFQIDF